MIHVLNGCYLMLLFFYSPRMEKRENSKIEKCFWLSMDNLCNMVILRKGK